MAGFSSISSWRSLPNFMPSLFVNNPQDSVSWWVEPECCCSWTVLQLALLLQFGWHLQAKDQLTKRFYCNVVETSFMIQ